MDVSVETYLVVALAFAVFSAVTAIGSSLVLGIGFERLRAGFEVVRKQTAYFSDAIFTLEKRVDEQDVKMATGGINTDKAESLVRHAENLLTELTHVARGMKADAESSVKEDARPMTIEVKNESLPTTIAHYASQWGDLGKDDKRQITLM
ncbi:MAG: hypothetical protein HYS17_04675 [Micavibrio aeruginosavorus]|uniref:Uncharacterized protein n=1 Tax=Micavibrio aeruginosavorus TaxID=349221 RepID=A0A7T5R3Y2_9BACT|nr:MAG: hypothetical protein HYS17_04675 [Micavibrio aeruginosavorus]